MAAYYRPEALSAALEQLARVPCRLLAGGTDFYPAEANAYAWGQPGLAHPDHAATLDLSAVNELHSLNIRQHDAVIEIGALVTWTALVESEYAVLPSAFDSLRQAGHEVGGVQIQNRGTLVGNLCNASPAADGVPPLLALDARVKLLSAAGSRELPLAEFILGNRCTACRSDELVSAVIVPIPPTTTRSIFLKLGARRYLVISIVMVALNISIDADGLIKSAGIAVGACSAVAQRLPRLEQRLLGLAPADASACVQASDFTRLSPIDDIRADAEYRQHAAQVLVKRGLQQLANAT